MERVVEGVRGIGNNATDVVMSGLDEVDSRNVMDRLTVLIKEEVEGDPMLPEVLHVDEGRENVLTEPVIDQDLVHVLIGRSPSGVHWLVQVQHPS